MQKIDTREQLISAVHEFQTSQGFIPYSMVMNESVEYAIPRLFEYRTYRMVYQSTAKLWQDTFPDMPRD